MCADTYAISDVRRRLRQAFPVGMRLSSQETSKYLESFKLAKKCRGDCGRRCPATEDFTKTCRARNFTCNYLIDQT